MKAACFLSIEDVQSREIAEPQLVTGRDAIVRVELAGLCGSDLHPFFGRETGLDVGTVMGHEMVGKVVDVGADVDGINQGDRVYVPFSTNCGSCYYCKLGLTSRCVDGQLFGWLQQGKGLDGCQSEFVRVPLADSTLRRLPDGISAEAALLLGDNFSTGYYCAEMAGVAAGGVYAVVGLGTVGQLCVMAARSMGADTIVAIDPLEHRRAAAEELGAKSVAPDSSVALIKQLSGGRGADAVMELVGLPDAQALAFQLIRPGGTMSVIGCHCAPHFSFSPIDAYDKNLTYRTGRCPARHYMEALDQRVAAGEFSLDPFVTHRFSIDEAKQAYDVFANRKNGCIKAVFDFA